MRGSVTVPATRRLALHSLFMPSPVTIIRLGALTSSASRQGATRRTTGAEVGAGPVDLAHVEARHLRRRGGAAEPEAALRSSRTSPEIVPPSPSERIARSPVTAALDVVAVEQPGILGADVEAHADAARRGEIERARARHGAAARGACR